MKTYKLLSGLRYSESSGIAVLDSDRIGDLQPGQRSKAQTRGLAEKAMQIHMQRIVRSFVGFAYCADQFYSRAVAEARDLTTELSNDTRDEVLDGPVGFDSRAQRRRKFAADLGLQATCSEWKRRALSALAKKSPAKRGSLPSARRAACNSIDRSRNHPDGGFRI